MPLQTIRWRSIWRRQNIDWLLVLALIPLTAVGLVTMNSFAADERYFFNRQIWWLLISATLFFIFSFIDWRFLRRSGVVTGLFLLGCGLLVLLTIGGQIRQGAQSWFEVGSFSLQPVDFMKIILVLILAKYFSLRHVEIAHLRHIVVSGFYTLIPFVFVLLQPDFGSAIIIFLIWFGIVLFAGISKKHLLLVFLIGLSAVLVLWLFIFQPYQKARILTFLHPLTDIRGAGYSSFQSTVAIGSGQLFGKGVGYGTQSRLKFLPEYQTDFIFAAFAEEWGLVGVVIFFFLFGVVFWRILNNALLGETNFEALFGVGVAITLMAHFTISVGMNVGLLPVTGLTLPFVSYGGSHLLAEFMGLGILMGMRRYSRAYHRDDIKNEFLGLA